MMCTLVCYVKIDNTVGCALSTPASYVHTMRHLFSLIADVVKGRSRRLVPVLDGVSRHSAHCPTTGNEHLLGGLFHFIASRAGVIGWRGRIPHCRSPKSIKDRISKHRGRLLFGGGG